MRPGLPRLSLQLSLEHLDRLQRPVIGVRQFSNVVGQVARMRSRRFDTSRGGGLKCRPFWLTNDKLILPAGHGVGHGIWANSLID